MNDRLDLRMLDEDVLDKAAGMDLSQLEEYLLTSDGVGQRVKRIILRELTYRARVKGHRKASL